MSRSTLVILIVASALTVLGVAICLVGLSIDNTWLHPETTETTHEIDESFESVSVNVYTANVTLIATDEPMAKVVCRGETEKLKYSVEVRDGTLFIDVLDTREWYDHISIYSADRSISVFLPRGTYSALDVNSNTGDVYIPNDLRFESATVECDTGDVSWNTDVGGALKIATDTGDIEINNSGCNSVKLNTDTGDIEINHSACNSVELSTDTGRIKLNDTRANEDIRIQTSTGNVILHGAVADGNMTVTTSTGDVMLHRCDAAELSFTTSTGDVEGSLLSDKIFLCETSTGDVSVPSTTTGGVCKIKTSTGDIMIIVEND